MWWFKKALLEVVRSGGTSSCGCLLSETSRNNHKNNPNFRFLGTHKMSTTGTYASWNGMISRCLQKTHRSYSYYSHIKICNEWISSFQNFLNDMGVRPSGMTLDRINNNLGYYKENCRWSTPKEQANNRSNNVAITIGDETRNCGQWAEKEGIPYQTILSRLRRGKTGFDIIKPPQRHPHNRRVI